jgi:valyl-tRNA synthetase
VGKRHALAMPVVIDAEGIVREVLHADGRVPAELTGLDRFAARTRIVELLQASGVLQKIDNHDHSVRHCYRCDTVVEPRLSDQWFVRMQPLADKALAVLRSGELRILPDRWEAVYVNWLEGIRDWNISRQLWWGHRIPVWYCDSCGSEPIVSRTDVSACPACGGAVRQDEDVLDTWFSSWLWPFSTLGWPDMDARDLKAFYPSDVLVTAPEILFFWVARMVMAGEWFMGRSPFHTVYLHGTVRDMQHRKMSKSLGNGIDPLDVVRDYGADALRWTVIAGLGVGVDVMLDPDDLDKSFAPGRNFCTKLWNIGRFLLARVGAEPVTPIAQIDASRLTAADRWILDRLDQAIADCDAALGPARPGNAVWNDSERLRGLRLAEYAEAARRFVWNELADWYLESVKPRLADSGDDREVARAVLAHAFDAALRLLHPIIPFITEELWQRIPLPRPSTYCANAPWPVARAANLVLPGGGDFEVVRAAVTALRQVRSEYNVPPGQFVDAWLIGPATAVARFDALAAIAGAMSRSAMHLVTEAPAGAAAQALLRDGFELVVPLAGMVDLDKERKRLETEATQLHTQLVALEGRLANEKFTAKAPPALVEAERAKAESWRERHAQLLDRIARLGA